MASLSTQVGGGALTLSVLLAGLTTMGCAQDFAGPQESETGPFEVSVLVDGLEHPWAMAFLPNGDLLVTERPGRLRLVRDGVLLPDGVTGVPEVRPREQTHEIRICH